MSKIDLPFDTIVIEGTRITSRYHDRDELFDMMCAFANLPTELRRHVLLLWRNSKGGGYTVILDDHHTDAARIGHLLSDWLMASGGHEAISIFRGDSRLLEIDQRFPPEMWAEITAKLPQFEA
jgi:hypothetical protein